MSEFVISIVAIVTLYGFFTLVGIGCPIKFVTGISCAGCGMTRAWISLLRGDVKEAFNYHCLFILPLLYVIILVLRKKIPDRAYKIICFIMISMFVGVYIVRLLNPNDTVVNVDITNGFLYKLIATLKNMCMR